MQAAAEDDAEDVEVVEVELEDDEEVIDIVEAEESPEVQAANDEEVVEEEEEEEGPLDLADLQNKRLGYAAEGLGLEGLIDIFAEENI